MEFSFEKVFFYIFLLKVVLGRGGGGERGRLGRGYFIVYECIECCRKEGY